MYVFMYVGMYVRCYQQLVILRSCRLHSYSCLRRLQFHPCFFSSRISDVRQGRDMYHVRITASYIHMCCDNELSLVFCFGWAAYNTGLSRSLSCLEFSTPLHPPLQHLPLSAGRSTHEALAMQCRVRDEQLIISEKASTMLLTKDCRHEFSVM